MGQKPNAGWLSRDGKKAKDIPDPILIPRPGKREELAVDVGKDIRISGEDWGQIRTEMHGRPRRAHRGGYTKRGD